MKVRLAKRFSKDYKNLPLDVQQRLEQKLGFLIEDPSHPSWRVHKLRGVEDLLEFSVTMNYRVLFEIVDDHYVLLGVGPHRIVDRI